MLIRGGLGCLICLSLLSAVRGQQPAISVQLPTISIFTVDTTVSVPDRGGMFLGGVGRQRSGRSQFFPPLVGSRPPIGVETGASNAHVNATIMDLMELDRQQLAKARQRGAAKQDAPTAREDDAAQQKLARRKLARETAGPSTALASVAEIRRAQAEEQSDAQRQGEEYLEQAQSAQQAGKNGAAKIYYQMAARRLTGEKQQQALSQLAALREQSPPDKKSRPAALATSP